jgi:hypothetical protein
LGSKAGDVSVVTSFDPLSREVEASSNGNFEVWEVCVFSIPFRGLFVGFLVASDLISESSNLLTKSVFHLTVDSFTGFDGFKQAFTDRM